ncbi:Serine/arginine-rich SC35-like splicing factor SCL28 isoform C [Glycine soja]|uniref:Serine/arginine-rich SC35-like splicing factor SCL28 isoform C n=1 Tax=Glycine soja TaxID=3848 RepID=A0A445K1J7_GLYSO|nr:Serine/arginine-rich SC35-like splicing factor SCL28 isoform C [Glycine soja]
MGRYRSRSRSYSPRRRSRSPPAPRGRKRYVDDRYGDSRSYRDRRSPLPSGLLVRNLPLDARPEDLRIPFERYGPVKDVYLPKNYYTGEPRGFGFVKYRYGEDAAEAKQHLNHTIIGGREIRIVFAEENRKTPQEMRVNTRGSGRHGGGRRRNRTRSPRPRCQFNYSSIFHFHVVIILCFYFGFNLYTRSSSLFFYVIIHAIFAAYSRSPSPARDDSRDGRGRDDYYSPERSRSYSRSLSPSGGKDYKKSPRLRENGRSPNDQKDQTPRRSESPRDNDCSPSRSHSR